MKENQSYCSADITSFSFRVLGEHAALEIPCRNLSITGIERFETSVENGKVFIRVLAVKEQEKPV